MEPSQGLINKETGTKQTSSVPTQAHFLPYQKALEDAIENSKNVPVVYYINEMFFLYDESDLKKETFITALNKKISYFNKISSISYFNKKTENEIFKILTPEKFLKFYVDKDATKNFLSFQLTNISGHLPKLKDKKTYNFSLTKKREKRKRQKAEPVEMIVIWAQQSFEIAGGLNQVQIGIEDDRVLNIIKKI